jgi:uncharacterized protein YkwD
MVLYLMIMKKKAIILILTINFLSIFSCSKENINKENNTYEVDLNLVNKTNWEISEELSFLINEYRVSLGLNILKIDYQYASAYAVEHTNYMIENNKISHDNFSYRSEALKSRGAIKIAENVAFGYETAEEVFNAWINSPSHKNIIIGSYLNTGFGVFKNDRGTFYFTQLFYK